MKKILFGLTLLLSAQAVNAQSGKLQVKGEMKGMGDTIIILNNQNKPIDTVLVKNNKFAFTLNLQKPTDIMFANSGALRGENRNAFTMIAVPNEKMELKGDIASRFDVNGSKFYSQYHEADLMMEEAMKTEDNQKYSDAIKNFIKLHPDYEASAAIIPNLLTPEEMDNAVTMLSDRVKNGRMKEYYTALIAQNKMRIKAQQEAEAAAAKAQAAGVIATDFTLNDINGKPLSLSNLRGKYVLLDFWGSWCIWCIKGMPKMKEYYEKYKGKFEILGIDCNDKEDKWKAAVEKYNLNWLHVYNPRSSDNKVLRDYAIQGFPTKILVGPDGKIVKTIVGEDPAFYTFMDETFGK